MTEPSTSPAWVLKRDGSRVPFDADKISQALFAATETLGRPDAFLARELTDGILHFLVVEKDDDTLTTAQIAEILVKTVRELGQPALAEAFAATPRAAKVTEDAIVLHATRGLPPRLLFPNLLREYAQQAVYSRQVLAAQSGGLLHVTGLETPGELEAGVIGPFDSVAAALEELRRYAGGCAVFDGPEYALLRHGNSASGQERFVREVSLASRLLGLQTTINLNSAEPPPWAGELAFGPLFAEQSSPLDAAALANTAEALLEGFASLPSSTSPVRINWHLAERDFAPDGPCMERLRRVARHEAAGKTLAFVFDRPRRPLLLAEGVDRRHSAVLLTVGLHLPQLAEQPGLLSDPTLFLQKLGSLTRLALSAAVQKREYLRRLERQFPSALTTGFLLDRARLVVVPVGLDAVVRRLFGRGLTAGGTALDFGKQLVSRLRQVLKEDGQTAHLEACLDGTSDFRLDKLPLTEESVAGLTPWDTTAALKNQVRAAGSLHALAERGQTALFLDADEFQADVLADRLRLIWETSEVASLCCLRRTDPPA